ncbi:MAG: nuclear transport factor 2 family protein [Phenylobacterium sp.]
MPDRERVEALVAMVEAGKFVEAIEAFYHPEASMQENQGPPRVGRDGLAARERKVMAGFKTMVTRPVEALLVDGDMSVIRWVFEFTPHEGPTMVLDELALQRWRGDRIIEERFYYDPAQTRPGG